MSIYKKPEMILQCSTSKSQEERVSYVAAQIDKLILSQEPDRWFTNKTLCELLKAVEVWERGMVTDAIAYMVTLDLCHVAPARHAIRYRYKAHETQGEGQ